MNSRDKVQPLNPPPRPNVTSGGNGNGGRLRAVEERLARIETELRHLATREDIEAKFASQLRWLVGTLITLAIGLTVIVLRLLA